MAITGPQSEFTEITSIPEGIILLIILVVIPYLLSRKHSLYAILDMALYNDMTLFRQENIQRFNNIGVDR